MPETVACQKCPDVGVVSVEVPNSCVKYTLCINGNPLIRECAPGTRFDRTEGRCNLQELVPCKYQRCPVSGRTLEEDPTSCRHYFVCVDGKEITRRKCNENLLFDSTLRSCALPQNVGCGSRPHVDMPIPEVPVINFFMLF